MISLQEQRNLHMLLNHLMLADYCRQRVLNADKITVHTNGPINHG
jgi:hypothetical protein